MSGDKIPGRPVEGGIVCFLSVLVVAVLDYALYDLHRDGHIETVPALLFAALGTGVGTATFLGGIATMRGPTI